MNNQLFKYKSLLASFLTALLLLVAVTACSSFEEPEKVTAPAKRTLLIYMIANNSLSGYDRADLNEMVDAVTANGLNGCRVLIYHHARNEAPILKELTDKGFKDLKTYPYDAETFSVDVDRMKEVIADSRQFAPANEYGIVLWSHGNGWIETSTSRGSGPLRAFGDDRGQQMKVTSLAAALNGQDFKFIYFDCCHMATVEVAYELRNAAPVIAASATELPAEGTDYRLNLPVFLSDEADMVEAAVNTFTMFDSRQGSSRTCTMSVIRTSALETLASTTREVMQQATTSPNKNFMQHFMTSNCSLFDLEQYVEALCGSNTELYNRWLTDLNEAVKYKAHTPYIWNQVEIKRHCGLATWIAETPDETTYKGYNNSSWWNDVVRYNPVLNP